MASSDLVIKLNAPNGRSLTLNTGLFIDNKFVPSSSGEKITSIDPTTEETICSVETGSPADVDKAVKAARAAFNDPSWRDLPGDARGALMHRLADLIDQHKEELATLETWDNGKPYTVALGLDMVAAIGTLRYYAGWADKIHGDTIPTHANKFAYTLRQPIGVCAQIIPWNYPILMAAWKLGPALATGNTVILKPAEQTPLSILMIAELVVKAGFPPGVINIVNGFGRTVGAALSSHLEIDKVAFTGSTGTGKLIQKAASANLKNVTLETGGKSALVIFPDADISQAARWAHLGIMANQGQICTSNSRLLVHKDVHDEFVKAFEAIVKSYKVGDPFDAETFQGPQVDKNQYDKILAFAASAGEEGATLVTGGVGLKGRKGYFVEPTVFTNVTSTMKVYREEIFGPFVVITPFDTEEEALHLANETEFGLAASVFTKDIQRAHRVAAKLEAGMVWVNSSIDSDFRVPFGGVKQSGIGRELGQAGLEGYLQTKAVHVNIGTVL